MHSTLTLKIRHTPYADVQGGAEDNIVGILDTAALIACFVALAMPFGRVVTVPFGGVSLDGFDFCYIVAAVMLCIKLTLRYRPSNVILCLGSMLIFGAYILGSYIVGRTGASPLGQARFYFPFILALLWLMAGTDATVRRFFCYLLWAAVISASSALLLNYFYPYYIQALLASSPDTLDVVEFGRLYWVNAPVMLFVVLYYYVCDEDSRVSKWLAGAALLISGVALLNTVQRTLILATVAFLIGTVFTARNWERVLSGLMQGVSIALLLGAAAGALLVFNPKIAELMYVRFLGGGGGVNEIYVNDLQLGRLGDYAQYWNSIQKHFPFGQGFGLPYSIGMGRQIYVTDVSFVAFLLPLGVVGIVIFVVVLSEIWRLAGSKMVPLRLSRNVRLLIVISVAASLNVDLFSRNNFVVALTLLVLSMDNNEILHKHAKRQLWKTESGG